MGLKETGRVSFEIATRGSDQLASVIYPENTAYHRDLQVLLLQRRFGFSTPTAVALALVAFGEGRSQ